MIAHIFRFVNTKSKNFLVFLLTFCALGVIICIKEVERMDTKDVFAFNLRRYMERYGKSRTDISEALKISYFTVSDWVNGKKYPRMDKVEMLASYFGIQKSDLIEEKKEKENPPTLELSEDERMFVEILRQIPAEERELYYALLKKRIETP